jgi:hypothetical protein
MNDSEIKIKTLIEKLIDSVYKTSALKTKKPEVELVQNILNGKPTDDRPYFDVYIKTFTSTENNFEFYIFKRKLEKRISIVFGRRITLRLFFDTIIPKNFHVLKDKANQYKEELQEKVNEYVNRQSIIGNDISINIDDVKVINTNWTGGNRMSFIVFATCKNKSNREEILRVDNPIIQRDLNRICTELLGHEYQDGVISGYSLEVDFVKNEVKENDVPYDETITEGKKVRLFTESVDDNELKWHRDREDRLVEVIEGNGWKLQFDNELPIKLEKGMGLIIPEGVYHRVIKGSGNLKVSITVLD